MACLCIFIESLPLYYIIMLPENFATKPNKTEPKTHFITATRHEKMQPKNQTKINNTSNKYITIHHHINKNQQLQTQQ